MAEVDDERFEGQVLHQRHPLEDKVIRLVISTRTLIVDGVASDISRGFYCGALEPTTEGKFRVLLAAER